MIPELPDHPSIVKPLCWFKTHQDLTRIGMYYRYKSGCNTFTPEVVKANIFHSHTIVVVSPLWDYVLCDPLNTSRSFAHCFPVDTARILTSLHDQLLDAIRFLKKNFISHNDIKEDNIPTCGSTWPRCPEHEQLGGQHRRAA